MSKKLNLVDVINYHGYMYCIKKWSFPFTEVILNGKLHFLCSRDRALDDS